MTDRRMALAQSYFDDAKRYVNQALTVDETGNHMEALELYDSALSTLTSGLAVVQRCMAEGGPGVRDIQSKMERMREQVKSRMSILLRQEIEARQRQKLQQRTSRSTAQPTTGLASTTTTASRTSSQTRQTGASRGDGQREEAKADLVFHVDAGIGLFEVDGKDHVRKYEDVDTLNIFHYQEKIDGQPPAFLQCGGFVFPLVPGRSPVLKAGESTYMFPELKKEDGSCVGIVLDSSSQEEIAEFDRILSQLGSLKKADVASTTRQMEDTEPQVPREPGEKEEPTWGSLVAGGINKGVGWVSVRLSQGTVVAGSMISQGATKLRERIEPNEKPTEVPESVQKGVYVTRKATGYVVGVSDFLMLSLAKLTVKVGKEVINVVSESEAVKGGEINPHAKEAWKVTKSSVKGAAAVFGDLERSASALVKALGSETSRTVGHKYGEDAGKVTDDSLHAAGNAALLAHTYWSWKTWGIHFLGKVGQVIRGEGEGKGKS